MHRNAFTKSTARRRRIRFFPFPRRVSVASYYIFILVFSLYIILIYLPNAAIYIYISPREPIHDILFIHSPVRCARAQLYTPRLRGGHDILGFLSAAFDLAAAAAAAVPTPHIHVSPAVITGPRPTVPPRHPPCSAGVSSSFVFRASVPCVLFRRAAYMMMTESRDVGASDT